MMLFDDANGNDDVDDINDEDELYMKRTHKSWMVFG